MTIKTFLVASDFHRPFHCPVATELFENVAKDIKPDYIILNGDICDFYSLNTYGPKHPVVEENLESEIDSLRDWLYKLKQDNPSSEIIFSEGNHEKRYEKFVLKNCPSFWNRLRLEEELKLSIHDIKYHRYNKPLAINNGSILFQHSPPSYSENAARTSIKKKVDRSYIWGCTHRPDWALLVGDSGNLYEGHNLGWMGSINVALQNQEVFDFMKSHDSWAQSFGVGVFTDKMFHFQQSVIKENRTMVFGNLYEV